MHTFGLPVVITRGSNTYGPNQYPEKLIPLFTTNLLDGEPVPVYGDGRQARDFIYVEDVIALLRAATRTPEVHGRILHAGTGRPQTVRDMVEAVVAICGGGRVRVEYGAEPPRANEPAVWMAGIEETIARTGWRPHHDLTSGIRSMWDWFSVEG